MKIKLAFGLLLLAPLAHAGIDEVVKVLSSPTCPEVTVACENKSSCASVTDKFCDTLWSPEKKGKIETFDGVVDVSSSPKSHMQNSMLADMLALISSKDRLPADLKEKGSPILDRLKEVLDSEQDSRVWYQNLSRVANDWNNLKADVATNRTETRHPEFKDLPQDKITTAQRVEYNQDSLDLERDIIDTKYKSSPEWKRVERVFTQAQADLLEEVKNLPLTPVEREMMTNRITTVQLSLPYPDPNLLGSSADCSSTAQNAFYSPNYHKFTMCAGFFNSFKSDSALYAVIAHEISHSIDPNRLNAFKYKDTPLAQLEKKLITDAPVPAVKCSDWKNTTLDLLNNVAEPKTDSLSKLNDCLISKSGLRPLTENDFRGMSDIFARSMISNNASANNFTRLAQPTFTKNGKEEPNPFYLKPQSLSASSLGVFLKPELRSAGATEVFAQAYACQMEDHPESRTQNFENAIAETQNLVTLHYNEYLRGCGTNCTELVSSQFSRDPSENFADWMSNRARARFLGRLDAAKRVEASAVATSMSCRPPSPLTSATDFTEIEKKSSYEPHPDPRVRRLSMFPPEVSAVVGCETTPSEQKFGTCKP